MIKIIHITGGMFRSTMRTQPNAKYTLQKTKKLHFYKKKFTYIKKKLYLCTRFKKQT